MANSKLIVVYTVADSTVFNLHGNIINDIGRFHARDG